MTEWSRPAVTALLVECGRIALAFYERPHVSVKDDRSVVAEADHAVEALLSRELDRPGQGLRLIGEETIATRDEDQVKEALAGDAWIVDPIDGTAPYSHHIPTWGHGVGWGRVDRPAKRNEPPTACRGEGARARHRCDGQGCRRRAGELSLLERADVEPRRRAAGPDEVAQAPAGSE